jgi:hypothetical protein
VEDQTKHGSELARYLDADGNLISVRANGVVLAKSPRQPFWCVSTCKNPEIPLERWRAGKLAMIAKLPAWQRL